MADSWIIIVYVLSNLICWFLILYLLSTNLKSGGTVGLSGVITAALTLCQHPAKRPHYELESCWIRCGTQKYQISNTKAAAAPFLQHFLSFAKVSNACFMSFNFDFFEILNERTQWILSLFSFWYWKQQMSLPSSQRRME